MARKKAVVDEKKARAAIERGVIVINTGNGKGKSSSAFGMVVRALGHDLRVGIVQFIKGAFSTGEQRFFSQLAQTDDRISYHVMGEGFTWETQDKARDIAAAERAWQQAKNLLSDAHVHLVVLDELNIALKHRYLDLSMVIADLQQRPPQQHVVITGRAAPAELIAIADTVTDMQVVKHAYQAGIKAQKGIEL